MRMSLYVRPHSVLGMSWLSIMQQRTFFLVVHLIVPNFRALHNSEVDLGDVIIKF